MKLSSPAVTRLVITGLAVLTSSTARPQASPAHPGHPQPPAKKPADPSIPNFVYDPADQTVEAATLQNRLFYDADVVSIGKTLWCTWLEFVPGQGDIVWIGSRNGDQWTLRQRLNETPQSHAHPTLTVDGQGVLWISVETETDSQWDVMATALRDGKPVAALRRVGESPGADIHHHTAADPNGGIWVAWQSDRSGQFDVLVRHVADDVISEPFVVGDHPYGDWHPSLATDKNGTLHVVWDAYDGQQFNVHLRTRRDGRWGDVVDVARSAAFEGRADVAVDPSGRAWIAWEEGGRNWGKPFLGIKTDAVSDVRGTLHRFRTVHMAVVPPGGGQVAWLADPLPMPSIRLAESRMKTSEGVHRSSAFYERAKLVVDRAGRVWVAYRHVYTPWLGVDHRSHIEEGWGVYARYYGADGWSKLHRYSIGQGDGLQRLELTAHEDSVAAVWTTGRTHRDRNKRPRGLVMASITGQGDAVGDVPTETAKHAEPERPVRRTEHEPVVLGGKSYHLFFGDLHRHTDLSLCRVALDGTIDDAYRYAIEVAQLDFLGITDHARDIAMGNALSQLWWRSRKEVYRHQLGSPEKMSFIPFYAYERSRGNTADHNVISLRGDMLRSPNYPMPQFWTELDRDTMTIPHQPIRRDTWTYQDEALRPLVEIFQGCRDTSIEEDVHRGLEKGYHLGFIASSDHMSTSASYACVWAEQSRRESVFRALQSRRTYGATAKIRLSVRAGDHWMGEIVRAESLPEIHLEATGTAPIRSVQMVVDGQVTESISPHDRHVELSRQLDLQGQHYVYFHLVQADGNQAWSSPIWLDPPR